MDIARPDIKRSRQIRRYIYAGAALLAVVLIMGAISRLKPAAPDVDRATVWTDTVKRGPMLRDVRGLGTLVPAVVRFIPAATDGTVEERHLLPGEPVKANTVILDMADPQLQQETLDAQYQLRGAEASLDQMKAQLQNELMDKRMQAAQTSAAYRTAVVNKEAKDQLQTIGLAAEVDVKTAQVQVEELTKQNDLAQKEVETFANSIDAQIGVAQASVDQKRALYDLKKAQMDLLHVRAGIDGVLQELDVDVGQRITQGTVLAKVANQTQLKAALQIAETQAKDIQLGQKATIDTHNGVIPGAVIRIDPAVVNGTRTVDVRLDGALPPGAVPQLSVEGTVEIEHLADILFVGRPVHGDSDSTVGLFKLTGSGGEAVRVQVALGRASVNAVEVVKGLQLGDQVILSDMSAWDQYDRVQLK
jgi:HlyD family secretion protein